MSENNGHEAISPELLSMLRATIQKAEVALIAKNTLLNGIAEQYKLTPEDQIDFMTGIITRKEKA